MIAGLPYLDIDVGYMSLSGVFFLVILS